MTGNIGRPRRESVDRVRGILWFRIVSLLSGKTAYGLEKYFAGEKFKKNADNELQRPCQWDKYATGKVLPSRRLVERVEQHFPGATFWLTHDLWHFFRSPPPSKQFLKTVMSEVRPKLVKYIGGYSGIPLYHFPPFDPRTYQSLLKIYPSDLKPGKLTLLNSTLGLFVILNDGIKKECTIQTRYSHLALILLLPVAINYSPLCHVKQELYDLFENCILEGQSDILDIFNEKKSQKYTNLHLLSNQLASEWRSLSYRFFPKS